MLLTAVLMTIDRVILGYHAISDNWPDNMAVSPYALAAQIRVLLGNGYSVVPFTEAVVAPAGRIAAITFDDGFESVYTRAFPVLAELGVRGTVFLPTLPIGSGEAMSWPGLDECAVTAPECDLVPMSWRQVRELRDAGWEIGSHSHTHARLTELDDITLAAELRLSKDVCEQRLGTPCRSIAYPFGAADSRVRTAASRAGYVAGARLGQQAYGRSALSTPRVGVYARDSLARFRLKVSCVARSRVAAGAILSARGAAHRLAAHGGAGSSAT